MKSLADVKFRVRIFTEIPGLILNILEDVADPLTQKMLYILYKMSPHFITMLNRDFYREVVFEVMKGDIMDWIEFQCVINYLIVTSQR